jgi:hypothetical protein
LPATDSLLIEQESSMGNSSKKQVAPAVPTYLVLPHYSNSGLPWEQEIVPMLKDSSQSSSIEGFIQTLSKWGQYSMEPHACDPEKSYGNLISFLNNLDQEKPAADDAKAEVVQPAFTSSKDFLENLVPAMKNLILRLPELFPESKASSVPLCPANADARVTLTKIQIAAILACNYACFWIQLIFV